MSTIPAPFIANLKRALQRNRDTLAARNDRISEINAENRRLQEQNAKLKRTLDIFASGSATHYQENDILRLCINVHAKEAKRNPVVIDHAMQTLARDIRDKLRQ